MPVIAGFLAGAVFMVMVTAWAQQPALALGDELKQKQITMLAAEAQFFNALAASLQDELSKAKAAPCGKPNEVPDSGKP